MGLKVKFECSECEKEFEKIIVFPNGYVDLTDNDIELHIHHCPSGGIYDVFLQCPDCKADIHLDE